MLTKRVKLLGFVVLLVLQEFVLGSFSHRPAAISSTYGALLVKFRKMDATSAHDQLGPGEFSDVGYRPRTGFQPVWTFTEGTTGPVSCSVRSAQPKGERVNGR